MTLYVKSGSFIIFLVILMQFCGKIEGTAVTCEPKYEFLPCTSGTWGTLFLIVIYQYLITIGQKYISDGSNKFFSLIGPGIFGASLFHVLANFPTLFLVLQSGLSSDDKARSSSSSGMNMLTGSAIMSLTIIWPSVITFGSYDLSDDNDHFIIEDEPSFLTKLTAYGVITDKETTYTARIMLVSLVPFIILQLPAIISSISITRVIILVTLIVVSSMFITNIVYQIFEPSIQNRRFAYVTKRFVKDKLQTLLSKNGKPNVRLIKKIYKELDKNHDGKVSKYELKIFLQGVQMQPGGSRKDDFVETIMDRFDISGDEYINETEFVRVLTIWLQDARKSVFQNDYDPLTFFLTPKPEAADKEQQKPLIPKETRNPRSSILDFLGALSLIFIGIAIMVLISSSFISNVAAFATLTNVPSFLIPYLIIPCAINIPRLLATIQSATQKTERATSLTFSRIYTGVSMSSMSTLTIFLLLVYVRDLPWEVSAQAFVVLIIGGGMAVFTSTRTVFPLWTGYVIYLLYPISLLMLYLLTVVWV